MSAHVRRPPAVPRMQDSRQEIRSSGDVDHESICWRDNNDEHLMSSTVVDMRTSESPSTDNDLAGPVQAQLGEAGAQNLTGKTADQSSERSSPVGRAKEDKTDEKSDCSIEPDHSNDESRSQHSDRQLDSADELPCSSPSVQLRFLVRRREAGALIGKRGANIKRLRECFAGSTFSIPDTGNGPERIVCIKSQLKSQDSILVELTRLLLEKSPENDEQIELKLLIHSSHAGLLIGVGGQSIKKLRNDSKAAIKIFEMCCPLSSERVCAIKAKPPVVVEAVKLINSIIGQNPAKGTVKLYDALHFNLNLVDKYGGYLPDELLALQSIDCSLPHNGGNNHPTSPCCDLPIHQHPNFLLNHQQQSSDAPEPNHPNTFPCYPSPVHSRFNQHHANHQRQPKHYATIWRSTDEQASSRQGGETSPSPMPRQHQAMFNQHSSERFSNPRFQRFHPYSSQINSLPTAVYQQHPPIRPNHHQQPWPTNIVPRPMGHGHALLLAQQSHPTICANGQQPIPCSHAMGAIINEHGPGPIMCNHRLIKHQPTMMLANSNSPRSFQCLPSLNCGVAPRRIDLFLRANGLNDPPRPNGCHLSTARVPQQQPLPATDTQQPQSQQAPIVAAKDST